MHNILLHIARVLPHCEGPHMWMSRVTHRNESYHTWKWVMSRICMRGTPACRRHVTAHMKYSCHGKLRCRSWRNHVTAHLHAYACVALMKKSCHGTFLCVIWLIPIRHTWSSLVCAMSHITHKNESCHACACVALMKESCHAGGMSQHTWSSHVCAVTWLRLPLTQESCHGTHGVAMYVPWHDSFMSATHAYAWRDSFLCVMWLIHSYEVVMYRNSCSTRFPNESCHT